MRVRVRLGARIAATVAVAVLGSTIAVTFAAYELERSGTENRFLAAARTGARADLGQAAGAVAHNSGADPLLTTAKFVGQRGGIDWVVVDPADTSIRVGSGLPVGDIPAELRNGPDLAHAWLTIAGRHLLAVSGHVVGGPMLVEFYDFDPVREQLARLRADLIRIDAVGLLVALLLGIAVAARISRPVRLTGAAAQRFGRGELDTRMPVHGNDELAELARSFNEMAQRLSEAMRALQASQAQQRRFVADVSHELRTPLAAMLAAGEGLTSARPELRQRAVELVSEQTRRMNRLVEDLLEISRFDAGQAHLELEPIDLGALARDVVRTVAPDADIRVSVHGDPGVHGDARRLHTVLRNLVANAVHHGAPPVHVVIEGRAPSVVVAVTDHGLGIDSALVPVIFDRFVRADTARTTQVGSTGLGLAIARENATLHGASLALVAGPGTTFALTLPPRTVG